ncbi:MAG TPA: C4-type zinc ribbon domain-containing protein [Fimbriimonadaceae bacterium]|nr:C4-type zinc ribbon domain-containing protein [Fimbriimonadaceae bacterium]
MPEGDLRKLWKLSQIDSSLVDVRKRAAALDPGKRIMAEIKALESAWEGEAGEHRRLHAEQTDLELQQKSIEDKLKKFDRELYGGSVVNPREVENLQREIDSLKRQRDSLDNRLLEIMERLPDAKKLEDRVQDQIDIKKRELAEHQKQVLRVKAQLEADFKRLNEQRPLAAKDIPPSLLSRYDAIRQREGGIGMAQIDLKTGACSVCGMKLPVKSVQAAKEERVVTCEACHRILYYTEGLV